MRMISGSQARERLLKAGFSDDMAQTLVWTYRTYSGVPKHVISYVIKLRRHSMGDEQIMIIMNNSTSTVEFFNVRRFFYELGLSPHKTGFTEWQKAKAKKFGFTCNQIEKAIQEFDTDVDEYGLSLMDAAQLHSICQSPYMMTPNITEILKLCTDENGRYRRALVEYVEWARRDGKSDTEIIAILKRCAGTGGVRRLLRLTTGNPDFTGRNTVSHSNKKIIKPKIRMQHMKYTCEVFNFFAENKRKIQDIARKYSDVDFMSQFYDLCVGWPGWSMVPVSKEFSIPDYKTNLRDGVEFVMTSITRGLPTDVQYMMINIAIHEVAKIVHDAGFESTSARLSRVMDPAQRR